MRPPTNPSGRAVAALALAIVIAATRFANGCQDETASRPPVSQCSDFACEP